MSMQDYFKKDMDREITQIPKHNRNYIMITLVIVILGMIIAWQFFQYQTVNRASVDSNYALLNNSNSGVAASGGCGMEGGCGGCGSGGNVRLTLGA